MATTLSQRSRIKRIRTKVRKGTATEEEVAELHAYDTTKAKGGRKPAPTPGDGAPAATPPSDESPADEAENPVEEPPATPDDYASEAPPPPPPQSDAPKKRVAPSSGDWRATYRSAQVSSGREETCKQAAGLVHGVLMKMTKEIIESGGSPIIDVDNEAFFNTCVIAVDELLPEKAVISPKAVLVGATAALTTQRWMRAKELKKRRAELPKSAAFRPTEKPAAPPEPIVVVSTEPAVSSPPADKTGLVSVPKREESPLPSEAPPVEVKEAIRDARGKAVL